MLKDEELDRLAKQDGSMVFGLLIGLIVDYEQTPYEEGNRNKRNKRQMALVSKAETRIRKVVGLGVLDQIIKVFEAEENVPAKAFISEEEAPVTFKLRTMRKEFMQK